MRTSSAPFQLLLITGLLTACGGGGGGTSSDNSGRPLGGQSTGGGANALTGRFVDGPVEGLRYTTPTLSGKTDANGTFAYQAGETVSFFVGDILIGRAPGAATVTPFTLAGTTPPLSLLETNRARRDINLNTQAGNNQATPLEIATNIALFLQTLDEDGDPANGEKIPAQLDTTGISINFAQPALKFYQDFSFRKLVANGRKAGLWNNGARAIKNPLLALDALYSGLKLTPAIAFNNEIDSNTGTVSTRLIYAYDLQKNQLITQTDLRADRTIDQVVTQSFDANGNLLSALTDDGANSTTNVSVIYTYDDKIGNLLMVERTVYRPDGSVAGATRTTYTYDPNGSPITKEEQFKADGTVNIRTSYTYDDKGEPITVRADGKPDGSGLADGSVVSLTTYSYDTNGRKILEEDDIDNDGVIDVTTTFKYDNATLTQTSTHSNVDGKDTLLIFTYDANNHLTSTQHETNGIVDNKVVYKYEDGNGNQTSIEIDDNGDGVIDHRQTYKFDSDNSLTDWQSNAGTGTVEFTYHYIYTTTLSKWIANGAR